MKPVSLSVFFIFFMLLISFSCKKDKPAMPANVQGTTFVPMENPTGITYQVYDAILYLRDTQTDELKYFSHFGPGQVISSLDPYYGPAVRFDTIIQNATTWLFTSNGYFVLNGQSTYPYSHFNDTYSVYGMENGSARPINVLRCTGDYMNVSVHYSFVTLNNRDYEFYTVISLKRIGYTGATVAEEIKFGSTYAGVINSNMSTQSNLSGTSWVVTKYISQLTTATPNDTINFVSSNQYRINGGSLNNYTLTYITGTGMNSLTLYGCSTLGGSYAGQILSSFNADGFVNDARFYNLFNNQLTRVWLEKI